MPNMAKTKSKHNAESSFFSLVFPSLECSPPPHLSHPNCHSSFRVAPSEVTNSPSCFPHIISFPSYLSQVQLLTYLCNSLMNFCLSYYRVKSVSIVQTMTLERKGELFCWVRRHTWTVPNNSGCSITPLKNKEGAIIPPPPAYHYIPNSLYIAGDGYV